mmetsp:Transcript_43396/g.132014  ORF Transcript_43396/g.132014 Transcript_43396/m.132014 type:complete len:449 (-) Transcript_43396:307-1653(-)|eukprot:CAMPEP_0113546096 /NCGR_PEP_ID=MMETSP0015_2-20120614/11620_1 /TAXON_ID=2838 /ORGANISM="Odontella" /LENGTH=448 /DNA_ID=CAMNT_0000446521 /DNA_START=167 /DNA_END=1513 /DNA_ORIENTATION=+ /assembly_acc=CAM_ASM_000160
MPRTSKKSSKRSGRANKKEEEPEEEEEYEYDEGAEAEHAETDEDEYESEEEEDQDAEEENDDDGRRSSRRGRRGGGGSRSKKKKSGGRKKVALMSESGQTDEDRRLLRRKMREFQQEIVGEKGERIEDPSKVADFQEVRGTSNRLWNNVKFTREAVLDADNFDIIATRAGRQAEKLIQVPRYDATRFCSALRTKLASSVGGSGGEFFDWLKIGKAAGACYCAVPSRVSFLNGPVEVEYVVKERKKREPRKQSAEEEEGEEERPDDVEQKRADTSGDKLSAVERNIEVVSKTLGKRCKDEMTASRDRVEKMIEEGGDEMDEDAKRKARKKARKHGAEVDAVKYLFNPKSFTQTVENIFHFSFLVKKGSAGISLRSDEESKKYGGAGPGPVVRAMTNPNEAPTPKQAIVSLTMQDWRDMCEAYSMKEGDIPHRNVSRRRGVGGGAAQSSK